MPHLQGAQGRGLDALSDGTPSSPDTSAPDTTAPVTSAPVSKPEPLSTRRVLAHAFEVYRARPARVAGTAAIVFGVAALLGTLIEIEIVQETDIDELVVAARIATALIWAFAVVFYAGLLDLIVGAYIEGRPDPTFGETLRALPLRRLFVADVLLAIGTAVGLLLFFIPGVIFFTLGALVGPVIVTEHQSLKDAFRRSAHLARAHFWRVLILVTIPVALEDEIMHFFDPKLFNHPLLASFLVTALIGAIVGSIVGLLEVVIAHQLRENDPLREVAAGSDASSTTASA